MFVYIIMATIVQMAAMKKIFTLSILSLNFPTIGITTSATKPLAIKSMGNCP